MRPGAPSFCALPFWLWSPAPARRHSRENLGTGTTMVARPEIDGAHRGTGRRCRDGEAATGAQSADFIAKEKSRTHLLAGTGQGAEATRPGARSRLPPRLWPFSPRRTTRRTLPATLSPARSPFFFPRHHDRRKKPPLCTGQIGTLARHTIGVCEVVADMDGSTPVRAALTVSFFFLSGCLDVHQKKKKKSNLLPPAQNATDAEAYFFSPTAKKSSTLGHDAMQERKSDIATAPGRNPTAPHRHLGALRP